MMHLAEIDDVWPRIAAVVWKMMAPHEVERMVESCRFGSALVLTCEEGAVIVTLRQPEDGLEMLIWAAVGRGKGLTGKYIPALQQVAREVGAHRITFKPHRRGWPRLLRLLGANWRMRADGMCVLEV